MTDDSPTPRSPLKTGDSYHTAPRKLSLLARLSPSLYFYPHMAASIWKGSDRAARGDYDSRAWAGTSHDQLVGLEGAGVQFHIENASVMEKLDGPCVFIGNHMSVLETFTLPFIIQAYIEVTFVVKRSLIDYPVFRHIMRSRDPIVVDRENPREDFKAVINGGLERLKKGISIIVFPQTTRQKLFDPEQFNTIGIKLAQKAGVPVIPVALRTDAWGNGWPIKDFGRIDPTLPVHIRFGEPIRIEGNGRKEHQQVIDFITTHLSQWAPEFVQA